MSSVLGLRSASGKIVNRSNLMTLGTYSAAAVREHAITLFGVGWMVEFYKNWEFIPTEGGRFYTIKLAGFNVAMARANNPYPTNGVWALYGNPVAMTENYVAGMLAQGWIIEYVGKHDADNNVVTIHPREAPDVALTVGEVGPWQPPWCSTKLRGAQNTQDEQWLVPAGVVLGGRFSVSSGESLVQLIRAGEPKYVSVTAEAVGDGPVPPQRVVVTLPQKRGLQFASDHRLIVGVMQGSQWTEKGSYTATLAADGQTTLTFERVDLALSGKGSKSGVLVAVKASTDAQAGDTSLNVQVGDQTSASSLIQVA